MERAALLVAVEGAVLVVLGAAYAVSALRGDAATLPGALVGAGLLVVGGLLLALVARGLLARRDAARAPAIAVQLLLALTGASFVTALPLSSVIALVLAAAVLQALASKQARAEFARD